MPPLRRVRGALSVRARHGGAGRAELVPCPGARRVLPQVPPHPHLVRSCPGAGGAAARPVCPPRCGGWLPVAGDGEGARAGAGAEVPEGPRCPEGPYFCRVFVGSRAVLPARSLGGGKWFCFGDGGAYGSFCLAVGGAGDGFNTNAF